MSCDQNPLWVSSIDLPEAEDEAESEEENQSEEEEEEEEAESEINRENQESIYLGKGSWEP